MWFLQIMYRHGQLSMFIFNAVCPRSLKWVKTSWTYSMSNAVGYKEYCIFVQADRERALRQREYLQQLEEDSEPTSLATTTEGEHTIQVNNVAPAPEPLMMK